MESLARDWLSVFLSTVSALDLLVALGTADSAVDLPKSALSFFKSLVCLLECILISELLTVTIAEAVAEGAVLRGAVLAGLPTFCAGFLTVEECEGLVSLLPEDAVFCAGLLTVEECEGLVSLLPEDAVFCAGLLTVEECEGLVSLVPEGGLAAVWELAAVMVVTLASDFVSATAAFADSRPFCSLSHSFFTLLHSSSSSSILTSFLLSDSVMFFSADFLPILVSSTSLRRC